MVPLSNRVTDKVEFQLGEVVYRKIAPDTPGILVGIVFTQTGVTYQVAWPDHNDTPHYGLELTKERSFSHNGGSEPT